jgi:hypothetical protein
MTRLLRFTAFAIAAAGLVDPAITVSGVTRPRVALVIDHPTLPEADDVRARLARDLSASYEMVAGVTSDAAAAIAIGDRYPNEQLPESLLVATVTTTPPVTPAARIIRIDAPREVPPATAIHLDVEVETTGLTGQTTDVIATLAGLEVGRASHRWAADEKRWRASIDAVPVGDPPYVIKARLKADPTDAAPTGAGPTSAVPTGAARTGAVPTGAALTEAAPTEPTPVGSGFSRTFSATAADVVVDLRREPIRVEFFDPRPSWATTFLRRALEADARFQVAALSFTSRGVSAQTGGAVPLADPRLDDFEVVIVGGLERLSGSDGAALQRYMRERGGAVVVVPDQRVEAGPARDLISGGISGSVRLQPDLVERLLEQPAKLTVTSSASLQASELLVLRTLPSPGSDVVARVPGDAAPVIVSMPRGDGRLLLSGAMDAWRFRAADSGAFDRFWQATIAGLALAVPPPIAITIDPPLLRPGEPGDVIVRLRSRDVTAVSASLDAAPIRLLPEPESGVFRGRFVAKTTPGRSTLEARVETGSPPALPGPAGPGLQTRTVLVQPDVERVRLNLAPSLAMLASSHRGIDVTPDRIAELERFLRSVVAAPRTPRTRHPMRSAWWIVPFTMCLSAEWWLRRRRGLR